MAGADLAALLVAAAVEDAVRCGSPRIGILILARLRRDRRDRAEPHWAEYRRFRALLAWGTVAFRFGKLGGGDVKLQAAAAVV